MPGQKPIALNTLKARFVSELKSKYPDQEILSFFNILTEHYLDISRLQMALEPSKPVTYHQMELMEKALKRLKTYEPIQYIVGETVFFGLSFRVAPGVLIPRPETEELVQWVLDEVGGDADRELNILDIGTGSGCIAISLARNLPNARVIAVDVSDQALEIAANNARNNKVSIKFIQQDVLEATELPEQFDVVISNPPYVRELEKSAMHQNVLLYEPETALYVKDENPLLFYRKITKLAEKGLRENGLLFFEINQYLAVETENMIQEHGFHTQLRKDIYGNFRMIKAEQN